MFAGLFDKTYLSPKLGTSLCGSICSRVNKEAQNNYIQQPDEGLLFKSIEKKIPKKLKLQTRCN